MSADVAEPMTATYNSEPPNLEPPPLPDPYTAQVGVEFHNDFDNRNVDWTAGQGIFVGEDYGFHDVSDQYFQDNIQYPAPPRKKVTFGVYTAAPSGHHWQSYDHPVLRAG